MNVKQFLKNHKPTVVHIAKSTSLIAATTTIVFGISAGTFSINYVNLYDINNRIQSAKIANYYSQNIKSGWNLNIKNKNGSFDASAPKQQFITREQWENLHGHGTAMPADPLTIGGTYVDPNKMKLDSFDEIHEGDEASRLRYKYASMILDGSAHSALDHSFNQSLYSGVANFIYNTTSAKIVREDQAQIYKPGQDTNSYFQDIYREASRNSRVVCLAGYNHVSPLSTLANQEFDSDNNPTSLVKYDSDCAKTGFLLIDGDVPNNQNIASVLFRSDQPAFLTGLATCAYFYNNIDLYHANGHPLSVAIYGGTAIPTVTVYMGGYQRGIEFFNRFILQNKILNVDFKKWLIEPDNPMFKESFLLKLINSSVNKSAIDDLSDKAIQKQEEILETQETSQLINKLYDEFSIKVISLGATPTHFTGSFVPGDAIGITKQYLNRGASAIICVAGPQSLDTAQEIKNRGSKCIVVGVDSAMETSDYQRSFDNHLYEDKTIDADGNKSTQNNSIIKFSAVKDMTTICDKFIRLNAGDGKNVDDVSGNQKSRNWDVSCEPYEIDVDLEKYDDDKILVLSPNDDIDQKITQIQEIECIDMSSFTNKNDFEDLSDKINDGMFANWNANGNGCIKFSDNINVQVKKEFIENVLFKKAKLKEQWFLSCPDANKSICNIGYKTCGNIQNGLISISFDGWYFLIQALLETNNIWFDHEENPVDFVKAWQIAATDYCQTHDLPEQLTNIYELFTFDQQKELKAKNGQKMTLISLYNDVMHILGQLFSSFQIDFSQDMSIDFDSNNNPIALSANKKMTVLDWLATNMYFCC